MLILELDKSDLDKEIFVFSIQNGRSVSVTFSFLNLKYSHIFFKQGKFY